MRVVCVVVPLQPPPNLSLTSGTQYLLYNDKIFSKMEFNLGKLEKNTQKMVSNDTVLSNDYCPYAVKVVALMAKKLEVDNIFSEEVIEGRKGSFPKHRLTADGFNKFSEALG